MIARARSLVALLALAACRSAGAPGPEETGGPTSAPGIAVPERSLPPPPSVLQPVVDALVLSPSTSSAAADRATVLHQRHEVRPIGSPALSAAAVWAMDELARARLLNARRMPAQLPAWVRLRERATLGTRPLPIRGVPGSSSTGKKGVTGPVRVIAGLDDLKALGERASKAVLLLSDPIPEGPNAAVAQAQVLRQHRDVFTAALATPAVALLWRTPVVGARPGFVSEFVREPDQGRRLPVAALTDADATALAAEATTTELSITLELRNRSERDADSVHVLADLPGRTGAGPAVILAAALDTSELPEGPTTALAPAIAIEAAALLRALHVRAELPIRVLLWSGRDGDRSPLAVETLGTPKALLEVAAPASGELAVLLAPGADSLLAHLRAQEPDLARLGVTRIAAETLPEPLFMLPSGLPRIVLAPAESIPPRPPATETSTPATFDGAALQRQAAALAALALLIAERG